MSSKLFFPCNYNLNLKGKEKPYNNEYIIIIITKQAFLLPPNLKGRELRKELKYDEVRKSKLQNAI